MLVQFPDISSFCGDCSFSFTSSLARCGVEDVVGARVPPSRAASPSGPSCAPSVEAAEVDVIDPSTNTSGKRGREEMAAHESMETEEEEGEAVRKKVRATI